MGVAFHAYAEIANQISAAKISKLRTVAPHHIILSCMKRQLLAMAATGRRLFFSGEGEIMAIIRLVVSEIVRN